MKALVSLHIPFNWVPELSHSFCTARVTVCFIHETLFIYIGIRTSPFDVLKMAEENDVTPPPPPNTNSQTFTHSTPPNRSNSIAQANMDRDRFNVVWQLESECITNTMSCNKCLSSVKFDYCGNDNFDHDFGIFLLSYTWNFNTYIIWHVFRCQLVTRRYVCQEERYNINNIYNRPRNFWK